MPSTLAKPRARTPLDAVQPRPLKVQVTVQASSDTGRTDLNDRPDIDAVADAVREADLSWKAFSIDGGVSKSQLSDAVNGRANFAWAWLWAQGPAFWSVFWPLVAEAKGVRTPNRRLVLARRAMEVQQQLVNALLEDAG